MRRLAWLLPLFACGRTLTYEPATVPPPPPPPPVKTCVLTLDAEAIDFGAVPAGTAVDRRLVLRNDGDGDCHLRGVALFIGIGMSEPGFSRLMPAFTEDTLFPGETAIIGLRFSVQRAEAPFERSAELRFTSDDPKRLAVVVPLKAHLPRCVLSADESLVTFRAVRPGQTDDQRVTLANSGDATCSLSDASIGGAAGFGFVSAPPLEVGPGARVQVPIRFTADARAPAKRMAVFSVLAAGAAAPVAVQLEASILMCSVTAVPNPFDFGNVVLNTTATHGLTLTNTGTDVCVLGGFFLMADSLFTLPVMPGTVTVQPGSAAAVLIRFSAFDSAPPHLRTGTLRFSSNDPSQPNVSVPLRAFINTICTTAGQFIYTVDRNGTFSRFDPASLTSTTIATLACMNTTMPFSMNLDQSAIAWVVFDDGRLFKVDTANAACTATSFVPNQNGFLGFGMGSVFDSSTGKDTLFIAGGQNDTTLGTLDLTTLTTSVISRNISAPRSELAGTGDGQLWAYTPSFSSPTGDPFMVRLNPADGGTLERHDLPTITSTGGYAIKFWGGAFYIFIGADVWRVPRNTLVPTQNLPTSPPTLVFTRPGLEVVGAGVSTCAPVMGP